MKFDPTNASESQECDALMDWVRLYPKIEKCLISLPNQALCYVNPGVRKKLSRQGVKKGIPDYFCAHVTKDYGGLFIEMKKKNLKGHSLRSEQQEWIDWLNLNGYKAVVCYGAEEAIKEISAYIMEKDESF